MNMNIVSYRVATVIQALMDSGKVQNQEQILITSNGQGGYNISFSIVWKGDAKIRVNPEGTIYLEGNTHFGGQTIYAQDHDTEDKIIEWINED